MPDTPHINDAQLDWLRRYSILGYDPACEWCLARYNQPVACVCCRATANRLTPLADAEYKRLYPNGPEPILQIPIPPGSDGSAELKQAITAIQEFCINTSDKRKPQCPATKKSPNSASTPPTSTSASSKPCSTSEGGPPASGATTETP